MDQIKTGKLIAKLRKKQGLTQRELGDKVNVGYRAVSKWETGQTMPDISIINELSHILGITSDELLKGELNNKDNITPKKPSSSRKLLLFLIPILLITIATSIIIINNNKKSEVYRLDSNTPDYYAKGNVIFHNNKITINIEKVQFQHHNFSDIIVKNYQYELYSGDKLLYGYGFNNLSNLLHSPVSIDEFSKNFKVYYNDKLKNDKSIIIKNNLKLHLIFITEDNQEIVKDIVMSLG